jgi:hypothetical protein
VIVEGEVSVVDGSGSAVPGAMVTATWTLPKGTLTQSAATDARGLASFAATGPHGTYRLTVTGIQKAGYAFDAGHSVLTASTRSWRGGGGLR